MRFEVLLFALLTLPFPLLASDAQSDAALKAKIMEETRVIAIMDLEGPSTSFKDDGDPETLQVVFLSKRSDGPSRVSPDGEVIFIYDASEEEQTELITKAFELRIARAASGS